jgi:hypothetical protein
MFRHTILAIAVLAAACGGTQAPDNKSANTAPATRIAPSNDYYSAVYALKGARMPDDAKLAEQKREIANALHVNLKKADGILSMNWDEKFKEPAKLKLVDDESVLVITFASAEGKPLEKGVFDATDAADAAETAAKDKQFAIITLVDSSGAKRLKGKVKVSETGTIIIYSFDEKPAAPKLDSPTYGAPFKN